MCHIKMTYINKGQFTQQQQQQQQRQQQQLRGATKPYTKAAKK